MDRSGALQRVGLVVLGANAALAVAKGAVWLETGSLAVGSEAANSLVDTAYSATVVGGLYLTTRPPDFDHPHGHERIEPFVSLAIAVAVLAVGALLLRRSAAAVLLGDVSVAQGPIALAVLGGTAAVKYLLYRYCLDAGKVHESPALVATALDSRIDVLTAGAAFLGVAGARIGFPILDPLAAGVVSLAILHTGVGIARDNVNYLIGRAPPEDLRGTIVERAHAHPEIEGVHDVIAHYVGPEVDVSLHVEIEGDRTVEEAHAIETDVMEAIQAVSEVDDVFVHVDPKELGEWKAGEDSEPVTEEDSPSTTATNRSRSNTPETNGEGSSG
jgi:cation diffusion facilitator family transporter